MIAVAGFSGCGGGSSTGPAPVAAVAVTLAPGSATVQTTKTAAFSAKVTNDPKNDGTMWTLSGAGCTGAACGSLSGTTSASGVPVTYTAPASVPNPPTVSLVATAVDDPSISAKATITLTTASTTGISVVVAPSMANVAPGSTQTFAATLQNDSSNKGVSWTLSGTSCTGSACGVVSPASSASGTSVTYTAPSAIPTGTITLTATSIADTSKSATAAITLGTPSGPTVSVTPGTANLATGGVTQTFTATVANDAQNLGVTWSVSGTNCMGVACGSIAPTTSASGVAVTYTSASHANAAGTVTVTATSAAEASATGTAAVTLAAPTAPTATGITPFTPANVDSGFGIPVVATDSTGNIDVAWMNTDGIHFTRSTNGGTSFSTPVVITTNLSKNLQNNLLRMVVDPAGDIDLLWYSVLDIADTTVGYNISRSTNNGATFTAPVQFTTGAQPITGSNVPTIVGLPDGKLVVTWIDGSLNVLAEVSSDGTTFSAPTTIAAAVPGAAGEQAVVDSAGKVYVFWETAPSASNCSISASVSSDGVAYSAGKTISGVSGACNSQPSASVNSAGTVAVTWVADATSLFFTLSIDGGATFATPISIATPAMPTDDEVVAGPDGGVYVLWTAGGATEFASSPIAGTPFSSTPTALGVAIAQGSTSLAADACGNITVIGANGFTEYQRSNDGGATFAAPVKISTSNQDFEQQLAVDKFGNVNFIWAVDGPEEVDFARLPTVCHVQ